MNGAAKFLVRFLSAIEAEVGEEAVHRAFVRLQNEDYVREIEECHRSEAARVSLLPEQCAEWDMTREAHPLWVYFFLCNQTVRIKIGVSTDPEHRRGQLQKASGFTLAPLLAIPGGRNLERRLHSRFLHCRQNGEWFKADQDLLDFIASIKKSQGDQDQEVWFLRARIVWRHTGVAFDPCDYIF